MKIELLDDLLEAVRHNSDTWNAQALEVIFYNRMIALEIAREFRKRRLQVDPKTVDALAFGEGFEQCATTWKAMVGTYLGWARPIEIDYNLSVSGMPLLRQAKFQERGALGRTSGCFCGSLRMDAPWPGLPGREQFIRGPTLRQPAVRPEGLQALRRVRHPTLARPRP